VVAPHFFVGLCPVALALMMSVYTVRMDQKKTKQGKIIVLPGLIPEKHELETASYFAALGKDVEFQLRTNLKKLLIITKAETNNLIELNR
jgi:hypothetical protein